MNFKEYESKLKWYERVCIKLRFNIPFTIYIVRNHIDIKATVNYFKKHNYEKTKSREFGCVLYSYWISKFTFFIIEPRLDKDHSKCFNGFGYFEQFDKIQ